MDRIAEENIIMHQVESGTESINDSMLLRLIKFTLESARGDPRTLRDKIYESKFKANVNDLKQKEKKLEDTLSNINTGNVTTKNQTEAYKFIHVNSSNMVDTKYRFYIAPNPENMHEIVEKLARTFAMQNIPVSFKYQLTGNMELCDRIIIYSDYENKGLVEDAIKSVYDSSKELFEDNERSVGWLYDTKIPGVYLAPEPLINNAYSYALTEAIAESKGIFDFYRSSGDNPRNSSMDEIEYLKMIIRTTMLKRDLLLPKEANSINLKEYLSKITGYQEEEISVGGDKYDGKEIKVYYGNICVEEDSGTLKDFDFPQIVFGTIDTQDVTQLIKVNFPKLITGEVNLNYVKGMEEVTFGKNFVNKIFCSQLIETWKVAFPEEVGELELGRLDHPAEVELPQKVNKLSICNLSQETKLPTNVEDLHIINLTSAEGIVFPANINSLYIENLDSDYGLVLPQNLKFFKINHGIDFYNVEFPDSLESLDLLASNVYGVKLPSNLKSLKAGYWDFSNLSLPTSLEEMELSQVNYIPGLENLKNLKSLSVWSSDFEYTKLPDSIENLNLPTLNPEKFDIGPNLKELSLGDVDNLTFPPYVGKVELQSTEATNIVFPEKMREITLNRLKNAKGVTFPDEVEKLQLWGLETFEGLVLPKKISELYFPDFDIDFNTFPVPEKEEDRENIINAVKRAYGVEDGNRVEYLKRRFAGEKVPYYGFSSTPEVAFEIREPKMLKVAHGMFLNIKKGFENLRKLLTPNFDVDDVENKGPRKK